MTASSPIEPSLDQEIISAAIEWAIATDPQLAHADLTTSAHRIRRSRARAAEVALRTAVDALLETLEP